MPTSRVHYGGPNHFSLVIHQNLMGETMPRFMRNVTIYLRVFFFVEHFEYVKKNDVKKNDVKKNDVKKNDFKKKE